VPTALVKILDRDLKLAGIPKKDGRGWTVDVHAMRHTFGTLLSRGNVAPRTAQAAMRHSSIDLTMNVYTDPKLLDVAGALERLPDLSLNAGNAHEVLRAVGAG
jgi:integrase